MQDFQDLDTIAEPFQSKGFSGYFISTIEESPRKIKELIDEYLQTQKDNDPELIPSLWLSTYLKWFGENESRIKCEMWLSIQNGNLVIDRIVTDKTNRDGVLMQRLEQTNLCISSLPKVQELIASVSDNPKNIKTKRFRL